MRIFYLLLVVLISLTACALPTSETVSKKWTGRQIGEAIHEMGPPQATTAMPDGTVIYTWEEQFGSATAAVRGYCRTGLRVDPSGSIVDGSQVSKSLLCK